MRQFLSGLTLAAVLMAVSPVMAQNPFEPIVYVNESAVTRFEVDQRIRFMQLLNAPGATPEEAEKALIEDRLRMQTAKKLGITVSPEALDAGLSEFAGRANLDTFAFTQALGQAGVESQTFRDFVEAGVAWRDVIRQQILPSVQVRDAEIDQALKREIETPIINRVLFSELIIPAPPGREEAVMAQARQIAASVTTEAEFASAARRLSATASAPNGGRLDWMPVDNLPPTLRPILLGLRPGQITQPLSIPGAVVLFFLRDSQGNLRPGASEQVLDYALLRLPSAQDAANVIARVDTCADLEAQGQGQTLRQSVSQGAIDPLVGSQLASLDADETATINLGGAVDVVMLCSRQPALLANAQTDVPVTAEAPDGVEAAVPDANALPDRQMVRESLLNQKVNAMASAYLAELYADAVIRRP
ncbi:peptidylprolyl isomerase [Paracoccus zhejiangensis]|uniref:Parvulin-like PPIase n=1 Tax=Paracoccus zhejiangensis TaxID=1077935 RepID=A0A2H5F3F7_9RHOB|nr:peptidylprolyl isomerase [Paracoccus zhejiangensis]AUH66088.1 peptidylprolyl isomerase [Paracoccus zhejiangensis]